MIEIAFEHFIDWLKNK